MIPDTTDEASTKGPAKVAVGFRQLNEIVECNAIDRDWSLAFEQRRVVEERDTMVMD